MSTLTHEAVMTEEVLENLVLSKRGLYVDCTFGSGGHSSKILQKLDKHGKLLSIDKDKILNGKIEMPEEFVDNRRKFMETLQSEIEKKFQEVYRSEDQDIVRKNKESA